MAAGTQATTQSWRWCYRTMGICNIIMFLLFVFLYEETKYTTVIAGVMADGQAENAPVDLKNTSTKATTNPDAKDVVNQPSSVHHELNYAIPVNPWSKRLSLYAPTSESIWPYFYRPFVVLLTFPAVLFSGLQYASGVVWLTVCSQVIALTFPLPPYHFTPQHVGFMSVGPFIGNLIGAMYGGFLGDWSILHYSRRNRGYYEPEMRLYILHIPAIFMCGGLIMFGMTIARVSHFPIIPQERMPADNIRE